MLGQKFFFLTDSTSINVCYNLSFSQINSCLYIFSASRQNITRFFPQWPFLFYTIKQIHCIFVFLHYEIWKSNNISVQDTGGPPLTRFPLPRFLTYVRVSGEISVSRGPQYSPTNTSFM